MMAVQLAVKKVRMTAATKVAMTAEMMAEMKGFEKGKYWAAYLEYK